MSNSLSYHEQRYLQRLYRQQGSIKYIYDEFVRKASMELRKWSDHGGDKVWIGNSSVEKKIELLLTDLHSQLLSEMTNTMTDVWNMAHDKEDDLVNRFIKNMSISDLLREKMFFRNADALKVMFNRKDDYGKTLSSRVWDLTAGAKENLEFYLASGLSASRPATMISQDIRGLLKNPDKRFRRIKDENGNLVPSQPMKDFHPGRGVYRSSYKNALRVAATETNKAYRTADYERWQNMDFVLGIEIERSPSAHGPCPICDAQIGKKPKDYKFTGFHPFCICIATPIMMDQDEFVDWLTETKKGGGKKVEVKPKRSLSIKERAKERHDLRTKEQIEDIKKRWDERYYSKNMPSELRSGSAYLRGERYVFDKNFFNLLDANRSIRFEHVKSNQGSYSSWYGDLVHIASENRGNVSPWEKKAVIYHEYGHCIDAQRNLWQDEVLLKMRKSQIKRLKGKCDKTLFVRDYDYKKGEFCFVRRDFPNNVAYIDQRLRNLMTKLMSMKEETFAKRGISKADVTEQIGSTLDTIKSLVITYGDGHSTSYFRKTRMKETEYLAHAFENTFLGNRVFQKFMPDIYDEMIAYIRTLKPL